MASYMPPTLCGDQYTAAATIGPNFSCDHATITVGADAADTAAVLFQIAFGKVGDWEWTVDREFTAIPETFRIGNVIGLRFRNKVAGDVATVSVNLLGPYDSDFGPGTPL